jgi:UDP-glucose 4-epimerase
MMTAIGPTSHSRCIYAASKSIDEFLARLSASVGLPVVIMRFFTQSARQTGRYGMVVPRFVCGAAASRWKYMAMDSIVAWHVSDVIRGHSASPTRRGRAGFRVGAIDEITIQELSVWSS